MQEAQQEHQLLAMLCAKIGQTWYDVGDVTHAQQYVRLGEQILQEAGIVTGTVKAYLRSQQSFILWKQGSYNPAYRLAQEARVLFEQALEQPNTDKMSSAPMTQIRRTMIGDMVDLGRTHVIPAMITMGLGQHSHAIEQLNQALIIFEHYRCQREIAIACCNLGDLYMRKADYEQAQHVLHRTLTLAEHIGEIPLIAFALGNLGILHLRTGRLALAETVLRQGITVIRPLNDTDTTAVLYAYLASVLQGYGKVDEARTILHSALQTGRLKRTSPIIGVTLIALAQMRIEQAKGISDAHDSQRVCSLTRARNTLQHALKMEALEAETRVEGQLLLAQVLFLEGAIEAAHQHTLQTLETARQLELMWLITHAQCLLGSILDTSGQDEQANQCFAQARDEFHAYGMHLAYGRTLLLYGQFLQQQSIQKERTHQQGQVCLYEAREIFRECHAVHDLQRLEQMLTDASDSSTHKRAVNVLPEFSPVP